MSKSLNNFFIARDILKKYDAEAIRYFFLSKHYRSPIDFNEKIIKESAQAVKNLYTALSEIGFVSFKDNKPVYTAEQKEFIKKFKAAMEDDFNTAKAIAIMFEVSKAVKNIQKYNENERKQFAFLLVELGKVLGFFSHLEEKLQNNLDDISHDLIELLLQYRTIFKKEKNWEKADLIRNDLKKLGIEIKDTPTGSIWEIKK